MAHEIDLIPASYRERLKIKRWCELFLVTLISVIVIALVIKQSLDSKNQSIQDKISTLQRDKSFNLQQQQNYNTLLATERRINKNLEILEGLRGGTAVRGMMMVIDRVLNDDIWFLHWSFKRAGEIITLAPKTVQTGYFIIIPQENSRTGKQQTWKLNTHMEIKGQARDHLSFSVFVQKLLNQAEIDDVKIIDTQVRRYVDIQTVDFNIVIVINNKKDKPNV